MIKVNYPKQADNYDVDIFNANFRELAGNVISLDTGKFDKTEAQVLFKDVAFNSGNGVITFTLYDGSVKTIDTLLEKLAVNFDFDPQTQRLIITLDDGEVKYIDLSALITQYEFLDSDTVAFMVDGAGKISAKVREGSIGENHLRPNYLADIKAEAAKVDASAAAAAESMQAAADSEAVAVASAATATQKADSAGESAVAARQKAAEAADSAVAAESFARGGTGSREGEDTDNAAAYYTLSKALIEEAEKLLEQAEKLKYVSTQASQGLTEEEKQNARENIGVPIKTSELTNDSGFGACVHLTQAEYDALPDSKLTDNKIYLITDGGANSGWSAEKIYYYNGTSGLMADNVQEAIDEIVGKLSPEWIGAIPESAKVKLTGDVTGEAVYNTETGVTQVKTTVNNVTYQPPSGVTLPSNTVANALDELFDANATFKKEHLVVGSLEMNGPISRVGKNYWLSYPEDGHFYRPNLNEGSEVVLGFLKIFLPTDWSYTMVKMSVSLLNYHTGSSADYYISSYLYGVERKWYEPTAYCIGRKDGQLSNLPVRFGSDAANNSEDWPVISIGNADTEWKFLTVQIHDISLGYMNLDFSRWSKGWQFGISANLMAAVHHTISHTHIAYEEPIEYHRMGEGDDTLPWVNEEIKAKITNMHGTIQRKNGIAFVNLLFRPLAHLDEFDVFSLGSAFVPSYPTIFAPWYFPGVRYVSGGVDYNSVLAYAKLTSQGMLKIWTEVGVDSNIMISFSYPVAD
nr:hypothetical protein [uncultured Acetatifactor sp.]